MEKQEIGMRFRDVGTVCYAMGGRATGCKTEKGKSQRDEASGPINW